MSKGGMAMGKPIVFPLAYNFMWAAMLDAQSRFCRV